MRFWPIKSLISSPFIEIPVHFRFNSGMVPTMWYFVFSIFTPIKFLFNISRSWWPFQCLNPRQRYQAHLLVEEGGVISIGVVRVTYRKHRCGPLWVPYVGVYVLQLLWGMWYYFGYSTYFRYKKLIGQEINLVNFVDNFGRFVFIIKHYILIGGECIVTYRLK